MLFIIFSFRTVKDMFAQLDPPRPLSHVTGTPSTESKLLPEKYLDALGVGTVKRLIETVIERKKTYHLPKDVPKSGGWQRFKLDLTSK